MAILKMKKLRLIAVRSNKEELLRELIRHGCVEISELEGELHGTDIEALVHRESSDVASLKSRHTTLTHAIDLLDHYAPKKGKLLSAKPELDDCVLLDDTGLAGALKVAEGIESYDARIKRISAEESRQRGVIQSLQPWLDLDLPLGTEGTERCAVLLGTIPARTEPGQVEAAHEQIDAESELFNSATQEATARGNEIVGAYRLYALAGQFLPVLNIDDKSLYVSQRESEPSK